MSRAIRLIQSSVEEGETVEVAYSGGKDSDIILRLVQESGVKYRAIYKCTTIDPPGTIAHCLENGVEILRPRLSFFQMVARKGQPSRLRRFCCKYLKEYKVLDKAVIGVRSAESISRMKRYKEPVACRSYSRKEYVQHIFPILDWTIDDEVAFIGSRGIVLHPLYYRADGSLDLTARLGCIGCPMASGRRRVAEFEKYPGFVRLYVRAIRKYIDAHPDSKMAKTYNEYEAFVHDLFFFRKGEWRAFYGDSLFGQRPDCKRLLEERFNIKL